MIRILLFGDFWNRQPLAYQPVRDQVGDRVGFVDDAADADIVLFSHIKDLSVHGAQLARLLAVKPQLRAVLLSEEPFWDTCWSPDPFSTFQTWTEGPAPFPYAALTQYAAGFFDTPNIPYFLLTDPRYIAQYRPLFDRNAGFTAADWRRRWGEANWDAAFLAEKRDGARHEPAFPEREVWGLSVLRSRIARHCRGKVLRSGRGWDNEVPRSDLPDWHQDKLDRLDLQCRYVSAIENTHMKSYVTEKIFDAFAVGGVPLYVAGKGHKVTRFVCEGAWRNLFNRVPQSGGAKLPPFDGTAPVSAELAPAYVAAQTRLARLFADPQAVSAGLESLADGLVAALRRLML